MTTKTLKRNIFQRIFGIPATKPPADADCCNYTDGKLVIDLNKVPELSEPYGAVHLKGDNLPGRLLVILDGTGNFRAFENKCEHADRKLDPVPGTETIQCSSMGQTTYNYDRNVLSGSAENPVKNFNVSKENVTLIMEL